MTLKVYMSYSMGTKYLADSLYSILIQNNFSVLTNWHEDFKPNENIIESVKSRISWSDVAIFFISQGDVNRRYLFDEIIVARTLNKDIIPILEMGASLPKDLKNIPYIVINWNNPNDTIKQIVNYASEIKSKKDRNSVFGLLLLTGALALLLSALSEDEEN